MVVVVVVAMAVAVAVGCDGWLSWLVVVGLLVMGL